MKLTQWFEPHEKPELSGAYEVKSKFFPTLYSYFDGALWYAPRITPEAAYVRYRMNKLSNKKEGYHWRGVLK